jgi:hypothetical protein
VDNCICSATRAARDETVATASTQRRCDSRILFAKPVVRQQHHAIARIARAREEKLTVDQLGQFGFFSGLRVILRADIILARFDLTDFDRNVIA